MEITSEENDQSYTNMIWANWPKICGVRTNVPKDGFLVIWSESVGTWPNYDPYNLKDFVSSDLAWQTGSCPGPTPTPDNNLNSDLTILPQTGIKL